MLFQQSQEWSVIPMNKSESFKEIMEQLQMPFGPDDIEWRVGSTTQDKKKGMALAYVTNRAIQNRLDDIFGPFGWKNEYKEWKGQSQLCGISIKHEGEWITKWDGASDSNQEAVKGGLSDSMKRAAYQWGIGRYLYKLPSTWHPIKQQGRSFVLDGKPTLPSWALPKEKIEYITEDQLNQLESHITELADLRSVEKEVVTEHLDVTDMSGLTLDEAATKISTVKNWIENAKKSTEENQSA